MRRLPGMLREYADLLERQPKELDPPDDETIDKETLVGVVSAAMRQKGDEGEVGVYVTLCDDCFVRVGELFREHFPGDDGDEVFGRTFFGCVYVCLVIAAFSLDAAIHHASGVEFLGLGRRPVAKALLSVLYMHCVKQEEGALSPEMTLAAFSTALSMVKEKREKEDQSQESKGGA